MVACLGKNRTLLSSITHYSLTSRFHLFHRRFHCEWLSYLYRADGLCALLHPSSFTSTGSRYRILGLCAGWLTLIFRVRLNPRESSLTYGELVKQVEFFVFSNYGEVFRREVLTTIP